jgi:hypothetical protein
LINFEPNPTQVTPASNQDFKFSAVGENLLWHDRGPWLRSLYHLQIVDHRYPLNNFTISQPNPSALAISVSVPQPGDHNTYDDYKYCDIFLKTGVTMKFLIACNEAAAASVTEPTPRIIPGDWQWHIYKAAKNFMSKISTSKFLANEHLRHNMLSTLVYLFLYLYDKKGTIPVCFITCATSILVN